MSRIGKKTIIIPAGSKLKIAPRVVIVSGPKGELKVKIPRKIKVEERDSQIVVSRVSDEKKTKALHGTIRQLINNAVNGVNEGWKKSLEVVGTGYRAALEENNLVLSVGFSHQVKIEPPEGITIDVEGQNKINISGVDRALVGQTAAKIKAIRPPDAYKGKGIRYFGEIIKLKPGKAAQTGANAG